MASATLLVLVLWAQPRSGFYSDDNVLSNLLGAARLHGGGWWWSVTELARTTFRDMGRLQPLPLLGISIVHYAFDRLGYKLTILALTVCDLWAFLVLVRELSGSGHVTALAALVAPAFFQTRAGSDPILSLTLVMQLTVLFTLLSLWQWARYLRLGGRHHLGWSLLAYLGALWSYEVALIFFLLHAGLALTTDKPRSERRRDLRTSGLYLLATVSVAGLFVVARLVAGMPWLGVNQTYVPTFEALPYLMTVLRQSSAALPLSYPLLARFRPTEVFTLEMAWAWFRGHWGVTHLLLLAGTTGLAVAVARRVPSVRPRLLPLACLGLLLWVLPALLLALSPKYRAQDWVSWGNGYLPVFASIFGVIALVAAGLTWGFSRVAALAQVGPARTLAGATLGLALGGVSALTATDTDYVVTNLNRQFRDHRDVAEAAMAAGVFDAVPDGAYVLLPDDTYPGANPSFFRTHLSQRFRRLAGPGHYLGEAYGYFGYFSEMFILDGLQPMPLPEHARRGESSSGVAYAFTPEDAVWFLSYRASVPGRGVAVLGRVRELVTTSAQLRSVRADQVVVFQLGGASVVGAPASPPTAAGPGGEGQVTRWVDLPAPGLEMLELHAP